MWKCNSAAYNELGPLGAAASVLFLLLSVGVAVAVTGWFKRRLWGWRLTVVIIAAQLVGNLVNVLRGDVVRGAIGLTIAGALFFYLLRSEVRAAFASGNVASVG